MIPKAMDTLGGWSVEIFRRDDNYIELPGRLRATVDSR